jgi:hypothetical protein
LRRHVAAAFDEEAAACRPRSMASGAGAGPSTGNQEATDRKLA